MIATTNSATPCSVLQTAAQQNDNTSSSQVPQGRDAYAHRPYTPWAKHGAYVAAGNPSN